MSVHRAEGDKCGGNMVREMVEGAARGGGAWCRVLQATARAAFSWSEMEPLEKLEQRHNKTCLTNTLLKCTGGSQEAISVT